MKKLFGRVGWIGWLAAVLAVGVESWMLVKIFVGSFLVKGMIGEEVFEAVRSFAHTAPDNPIHFTDAGKVLQQRSKGSILGLKKNNGRNINIAARASKAAQSFRPGTLGQYLLTLPLAFIPFVGWALFVYINASKTAKGYVAPYLNRGRGLSTEEQRQQVLDQHVAEFNTFGAVALILEQIPIAGALFQITNFVGAALWVEKLDASRQIGDLRS